MEDLNGEYDQYWVMTANAEKTPQLSKCGSLSMVPVQILQWPGHDPAYDLKYRGTIADPTWRLDTQFPDTSTRLVSERAVKGDCTSATSIRHGPTYGFFAGTASVRCAGPNTAAREVHLPGSGLQSPLTLIHFVLRKIKETINPTSSTTAIEAACTMRGHSRFPSQKRHIAPFAQDRSNIYRAVMTRAEQSRVNADSQEQLPR